MPTIFYVLHDRNNLKLVMQKSAANVYEQVEAQATSAYHQLLTQTQP